MADDPKILIPDALNERYTLWLNRDGKPVERTLHEMTSGEVLAAVGWLTTERRRLQKETAEFSEFAEAVTKGDVGPEDLTEEERDALPAKIAVLSECAAVAQREAHLLMLIRATMPQWGRHPKLTLRQALGRFWPR